MKRPEWAVMRLSCEAEGPLGLNWPFVAAPAELAGLGMPQRIPNPSRPRGGARNSPGPVGLACTHCDSPLKKIICDLRLAINGD